MPVGTPDPVNRVPPQDCGGAGVSGHYVTFPGSRSRAGLVVTLIALGAMPIHSTAPTTVNAAAVSLATNRLEFGLANEPSGLGWMTSSGVPWRYRYQYLAGGVNTGKGWETWDQPAGAFAGNYMAASSGANYIPVLTYYELLQSNPATGSAESDRDLSNLNNATTMNAYFANFVLLMHQAASYAKPVVVHVEPDLWGYLEQSAAGRDASSLSAKVAGSGFADVAGIPDTAQGFGWALLKLRDLYAPNVIMAIHASAWGSGIDIASDTSPSVSATSTADATASFLNSAGLQGNPYGHTWDLVFNDVDDHDAGWWEAQGADNPYFTHWWDPTNTRFPNFSRYLSWVAELRLKTGVPQVVWQVPDGNQYFLTMNNTCGHYQDTVAPYFIAHASDLYAAGLIAVLFGAGNACQTSYMDAMADGVTNNSGTPTIDLAGFCNACNIQPSAWPDDDGGYMRIFVGRYYAGEVSLGGSLISGPGTASCAAGSIGAFALGGDGVPWWKTYGAGAWSGWNRIGGNLAGNPAAVCEPGATTIDVLVRGQDSALWHRRWTGSAWLAWESLGGSLTSGPSAVSCSAGNVVTFVLGGDGVVWEKVYSGIAWGGWIRVGGNVMGDPRAVCEPGTTSIDLLVEGTNRNLYHRQWNGGSWGGWDNFGGSLSSSPAVSSCASGTVQAFVLGGDGVLWRKNITGGSSTAWTVVGGTWTSDPAAVCAPDTTAIHIFERGPEGALWHLTLTA